LSELREELVCRISAASNKSEIILLPMVLFDFDLMLTREGGAGRRNLEIRHPRLRLI
jgi:hypothetical protein